MSKEKIPCALLMNDIHISKDNIPEFQKNWDEALKICEKQDIQDLIIGGDMLQSRSSYHTLDVLLAVRQALIKATLAGLELTIAEGNHDLVDQEAMLGYCHVFSEYPHVHVIDDYTVLDFSDDVVLYVMSYFPEKGTFVSRLQDILDNDFDADKYNILYIHEGINGGLTIPSENELPTKIFKDFDKVLVGHYHNRCKIKGTNIEYIGASRQHNFGEDEEKGYTILYSDGSYEFAKNQANIRYKMIDLTLQDVDNNLIDELNNVKIDGKYKVKARINCSATDVQNIDKQKLLEAGAAKVEIVTEKTVAKAIEAHSLDRKFDKTGIKQEYESFCSEKVIDSSMGLQYLDKIN